MYTEEKFNVDAEQVCWWFVERLVKERLARSVKVYCTTYPVKPPINQSPSRFYYRSTHMQRVCIAQFMLCTDVRLSVRLSVASRISGETAE